MAFTQITKLKRGARPQKHSVRLAIFKHDPKTLQIIIPDEISKQLNASRFFVHVGSGADAGLLLLQPTDDASGFKLVSAGGVGKSKSRKICVTVNAVTTRNLQPFGTTEVQHTIEPEGLVVHVGAVFRINAVHEASSTINPRMNVAAA